MRCVCLVSKRNGQLGFPKGSGEIGDRSALGTAKREWREETNLADSYFRWLDDSQPLVDKWGCSYFVAEWHAPDGEPGDELERYNEDGSWDVADDPDDPDPVVRACWMPVATALGRWRFSDERKHLLRQALARMADAGELGRSPRLRQEAGRVVREASSPEHSPGCPERRISVNAACGGGSLVAGDAIWEEAVQRGAVEPARIIGSSAIANAQASNQGASNCMQIRGDDGRFPSGRSNAALPPPAKAQPPVVPQTSPSSASPATDPGAAGTDHTHASPNRGDMVISCLDMRFSEVIELMNNNPVSIIDAALQSWERLPRDQERASGDQIASRGAVEPAGASAGASRIPDPEEWLLYASSAGEWLYHSDAEWFYVESPGEWQCFTCTDLEKLWWWHESSGRWFWHPVRRMSLTDTPPRSPRAI